MSLNGGFECRWGRRKSTYLWLHSVLNTATAKYLHTASPDDSKLVTLIAGSNKRGRLLFAEDGRRSVYDKKPQRYAEDNRTAFNCKSEA